MTRQSSWCYLLVEDLSVDQGVQEVRLFPTDEFLMFDSLFSPQHGRGRARVTHAVVVIFLEFFAWGLLTTPMLTVSTHTSKHTPLHGSPVRMSLCLQLLYYAVALFVFCFPYSFSEAL